MLFHVFRPPPPAEAVLLAGARDDARADLTSSPVHPATDVRLAASTLSGKTSSLDVRVDRSPPPLLASSGRATRKTSARSHPSFSAAISVGCSFSDTSAESRFFPDLPRRAFDDLGGRGCSGCITTRAAATIAAKAVRGTVSTETSLG